jgi:hypothetical protein
MTAILKSSIINRKSSMRQPDYPSKFKNLKAQILTVQGIHNCHAD